MKGAIIMNEQLALVDSQNFGNVQCDFWQGENKQEAWMTREQIGLALGYSDPIVAITKIHNRHKVRMDKFSTVTSLVSVEGKRTVNREFHIYSSKGIYEICRWSRQAKADAFMDWVWETIDKLRTGECMLSQGNITFSPQAIESIIQQHIANMENNLTNHIDQRLTGIENNILYLSNMTKQSSPESVIDTIWKERAYSNIIQITKTQPKYYKQANKILKTIYNQMRNIYAVDWVKEKAEFKEKYSSQSISTINIVASKEDLKSMFEKLFFKLFVNTDQQEIKNSITKEDVKKIINPLIEKRQDQSYMGNRTYQTVYSKMDVNWQNRLTRYRNIKGLKNNPQKSKLIIEDPNLYKKFQKTVKELLN